MDIAAAPEGSPREPKAHRRQNAREQTTSEWVVIDGLLDAIQERLAQLGER